MTTCVSPDVNGYIVANTQTLEQCEGYILISPTEYYMATEIFEITPSDIAYVFSWGFGSVVFFGLGIPFAVKIARDVIRLI